MEPLSSDDSPPDASSSSPSVPEQHEIHHGFTPVEPAAPDRPTPVPAVPVLTAAPAPAPPAPEPAAVPATPPTPPPHSVNSPGQLILQWLTYAFWGWTILASSILVGMVMANYIKSADTGGFTPYAVAAALVLLPISFFTDFFYSKHEPLKKTGGATIIMVIHAVLYALFAIGSLITVVFSLVSYFTSSSGTSDTTVVLLTALVVLLLYAAVFLRVLTPHKPAWLHKVFLIFMVAAVGLIVLFGIIGPTMAARQLRSDKLIEDNISNVTDAINLYTTANRQLPSSLNQLNLTGDTLKMVQENLVTYTPNTGIPANPNIYSPTTLLHSTIPYYYQLCTTFKKAAGTGTMISNGEPSNSYSTFVDAYDHPAGHVCYKLETTTY